MKIATAMQMNAVDDALIHQYGYSIYELVEMASQHLLEEMPKRKSYLLLAGPGNNGADALSLAKRLIEDGKEVYVQLFYFEHANSTVQHFYELIKDQVIFVERWVDTEVVVDGIFGNGLSRALDKDLQRYLQQINQLDGIHIAIDSPTGINATTGAMQSVCFQAEKTVTFMCYKLAMMNQDLRKWFGTITVKTFGIEQEVLEHSLIADAIDQNVISSFFKRRKNHDHKGVNGKITHFTGSREYTGAACLASLASVYSGSGIVRVCSDDYVLQ
ncbi:MAG: NAD(P)H-hydrate epimerase, partial [Beduini sp.]